jgi:DNA-binding XRE family transcriptional regulator
MTAFSLAPCISVGQNPPVSLPHWQALLGLVGERIRLLRERMDVSQERLGELAAINKETVNRIERGENRELSLSQTQALGHSGRSSARSTAFGAR